MLKMYLQQERPGHDNITGYYAGEEEFVCLLSLEKMVSQFKVQEQLFTHS